MRRQIATGLVALALAVTAVSESSRPAPEPAEISLQVSTATPKPERCQGGFPGNLRPYCLERDGSVTVESGGYGDGNVHYSVCVYGRPGLALDLRGYWYDLETKARQPMPEAPAWRMVAASEEHCEYRQWPAAWPGGLWAPDLRWWRQTYAPWLG